MTNDKAMVADKAAVFQQRLADVGYVCDSDLALVLQLFASLERPLLLEGDAGVGKTYVAQALARLFDCPLIRLQCYEGLDIHSAVYEWNYQRQMLAIRLLEGVGDGPGQVEDEIFSEKYLLPRPLLQAIRQAQVPVLLIDEVDRADEEFEAFLLELLSEFQITIPELGTLTAAHKPRVVLTSNASRELSDALRRRCWYYYLDFPSREREWQILRWHLPQLETRLGEQVIDVVKGLRRLALRKKPGIAETLDWARALLCLEVEDLSSQATLIRQTLGCLLKTRSDHALISEAQWQALLAVKPEPRP